MRRVPVPVVNGEPPTGRYTLGLFAVGRAQEAQRGEASAGGTGRDIVLVRNDLIPLLGREAAANGACSLPPEVRVDLPADRALVVVDRKQVAAYGAESRRRPGLTRSRERRADRFLRLQVPECDGPVYVRGGQNATVGGEIHRDDDPRTDRKGRPHPPPVIGLPELHCAVDLAGREQAAVRREGDRADLVLGWQPGDLLAAVDIEDLDPITAVRVVEPEGHRKL